MRGAQSACTVRNRTLRVGKDIVPLRPTKSNGTSSPSRGGSSPFRPMIFPAYDAVEGRPIRATFPLAKYRAVRRAGTFSATAVATSWFRLVPSSAASFDDEQKGETSLNSAVFTTTQRAETWRIAHRKLMRKLLKETREGSHEWVMDSTRRMGLRFTC